MTIAEHQATSVSDYIEKISRLSPDNKKLWFRGHANHSYKLEPSIYRTPYNWECEETFMNEFKAKAIRFISVNTESYWEWLFIMQHHNTPTRLLDWTENALTALAFASQYREEKDIGADAIVWCLNPEKLNKAISFGPSDDQPIPNICENTVVQTMYQNSSRTKRPIAIIGPQNNDRIVAQKGVFTLFPEQEAFEMEALDDAADYLTKVVINHTDVEKIAKELYFMGITETSLFPELDSISKEIRRNYISR